MLIARSPVRVSFFGGGTDVPAYYERHGGAVLSTTIDKYVYVHLNTSTRDALQITSSDYRTFYRHTPGEPLLWDGDLSLPRAVLQQFGVEHSVSIFLASEAPPGTGLGSSSAVTVALIKGISAACGLNLTKAQVAELACYIEIEKLAKPIGRQDQYAAAFGGLNWITFDADEIAVQPINVRPEIVARLESNLLLMFTGATHDSAQILIHQTRASKADKGIVVDSLQAAHDLALQARGLLHSGQLDRFGALLDVAWQHKKHFAPGVSNDLIDRCYALARNNGALGGKIAGAGGGGFLLLYCDDGSIDRVESILMREGLRRMDFRFENDGGRVLFNAGLRLRHNPNWQAPAAPKYPSMPMPAAA
jgi:D-glycero-alpha-D-manno-heptose-7-phosphate kinase